MKNKKKQKHASCFLNTNMYATKQLQSFFLVLVIKTDVAVSSFSHHCFVFLVHTFEAEDKEWSFQKRR